MTFDWCAWGPYTTCEQGQTQQRTKGRIREDYFLSRNSFLLNVEAVRGAQQGRKDSR